MELSAGIPRLKRAGKDFLHGAKKAKQLVGNRYPKRRRYKRIAEIKINCASFGKLLHLR